MNRGRMSFGMWLVLAGLLVLLTNLGWLEPTFWRALFELWPLLLILFGLHLVFSRTFLWFVPVLGGLAIAGAVFVFGADIPFLPWANPEQVTEQFEYAVGPETERLDIDLKIGAAELTVRRGGAASVSAHVTSVHPPVVTHETRAGNARLAIDQSRGPRLWWRFFNRPDKWEVLVPPDVPVNLDLDGGAGSFQLNLRGLDVHSVMLRSGAAEIGLEFDAIGTHTGVEVESGVSGVRVKVPRDAGLRVHLDGLTDHNLSTVGLLRGSNGYWQTPDYDATERTIEIHATTGLGDLKVERY